ncbi:MAG: dihydrofolate reductase family protein [Ruthenibacterium lactatiformans]
MERKVILYLAMSLDGFIADKNGGVGWMDLANNGEAFEGDYGYAAFSAEVDTVLMGMTTYRQITQELSPGAWPYVGMGAKCSHTVHPRRTQTPFLRPRTRQRRYAA